MKDSGLAAKSNIPRPVDTFPRLTIQKIFFMFTSKHVLTRASFEDLVLSQSTPNSMRTTVVHNTGT